MRFGSAQSRVKQHIATRRLRSAPSPLTGEGWGEGGDAGDVCVKCEAVAPSPQPSPARGEGAKILFTRIDCSRW